MTLARFNLPAAFAAPATALLLATAAPAATDQLDEALLHEKNADSPIAEMNPTVLKVQDQLIVVGPTMDYAVYQEHGGDAMLDKYQEWPFENEREIIDAVQAVYDEDAPYASGGDLPRSITTQMNVGAMLPEAANPQPISGELAERLPDGPEWVAVGEHLVALDAHGRIAHVYWDMLPL